MDTPEKGGEQMTSTSEANLGNLLPGRRPAGSTSGADEGRVKSESCCSQHASLLIDCSEKLDLGCLTRMTKTSTSNKLQVHQNLNDRKAEGH